jgi:hypothetical protein
MKIYTHSVTGRKYSLSGRCIKYLCTQCGRVMQGYDAIAEYYVCSDCRISRQNESYQKWVAETGGYKNEKYNEKR